LESLEARIDRLEAIEAIKQLKSLYCEICDDGHNPDRIVSIFTEDGVWEGRGIGKAQGHAQIADLFKNFQEMMSFTQHMVMNPRIAVQGMRATATWYFFGPFTFRENDQAKWQAARYHEEYVKQGEDWKIQSLRVSGPGMSVNYEVGWGESRYQ
jgi:hypothetical protein